jgi:predicted DsbA family dithiol-disulfide isomerase
MAEEVEAKAPPPTDEEVEAYYLGQKDRINRPLEAVRGQLRQGLWQVKLQQIREQFHRRLREKAKVSILLRPPKVEVAIDTSRVRGDPRAPVTIVEFSDFQCPFCQRIQPTLLEILARYPGKVRLAYRDYPLSQIHPRAQKAAEAARCAGEQGKFWEYHDMLYADVSKLADADLAAHARGLEIDEAKFGACLESGRHSAGVDQDQKDGVNAGVNGTPAFLVNGVMLEGAQPITAFESIIESELAALKAGQ